MKILDIQQRTPEWEYLRRSCIGSSDAPILMGSLLEYGETPYKLFKRKTEGTEKFVTSAMRAGAEKEEEARKFLGTLMQEEHLTAPVVWSEERGMKRIASLDAARVEENGVVSSFYEIKIPQAKKLQELFESRVIPPEYEWQLIHQLDVCQMGRCCLFVYNAFDPDLPPYLLLSYTLDAEKRGQLLEAEASFFSCLQTGEAPGLTLRDYDHREDPSWKEHSLGLLTCREHIKLLKEQEEEHKQWLVQAANGQPSRGGGVIVSCANISEKTDVTAALRDHGWDSAPILARFLLEQGVDLEEYHIPAHQQWRVSEDRRGVPRKGKPPLQVPDWKIA